MKNITIKLQAEDNQQVLLKAAASVLDVTVNDFILESACREATEVILNQNNFSVSPDIFQKFVTALDAPIPNVSNLKALLNKPSPWE